MESTVFSNNRYTFQSLAFVLSIVFGILAAEAMAKDRITFDAIDQVACTDITDQSFAEKFPGDRLLEAKFEISTLFHGSESSGIELFYQIYNPGHSIRILDYSPRTELTSEYNGGIKHQLTDEKLSSIGFNASANVEHIGALGANLGGHKKKNATQTYEKLAPKKLLTASGTISRAGGVYYKLKTSNQTTLEGSRTFVVRFRVSQYWNGDVIQVHCAARRKKSGFGSSNELEPLSRGDFLVATYLASDSNARRVVQNFSKAESGLRAKAKLLHDEIERRSFSNPLERLGGALKFTEGNIPKNWLGIVLYDQPSAGAFSFYRDLPVQIQKSVDHYVASKKQLMSLASAGYANR